MTWEETILQIRKDPTYKELIDSAYIDEDLELNAIRFFKSEEFEEVIKIISSYSPRAKTILDIGAGNGISTVSFAKKGFEVTAVEPDPSNTVGAGAIKILKEEGQLENITILESTGEKLSFNKQFDVIYSRQAMHHANDLFEFLKNLYKHCNQGGLLITTRDHVIYNKKDKTDFLNNHPLHKYYGGENAYKMEEYAKAITEAGFTILKIMKHYDSVINYAPLTKKEFAELPASINRNISEKLKRFKLPANQFIIFLYKFLRGLNNPYNESLIKGRLNSFICIKE
jgi:SAM-dependent methyltransferase